MKQCPDCKKQKKADNCIECAVEAKNQLSAAKQELTDLKKIIEQNDFSGRIIAAIEKLKGVLNG